MSFLKDVQKFFKTIWEPANSLDLLTTDEQVMENLMRFLLLKASLEGRRDLLKALTEIFSIFEDSLGYKILNAFLKHGPMNKSKLCEIFGLGHYELSRGPLKRVFDKLLEKGIIIDLTPQRERGKLYGIAPRYEPLLKLLLAGS